MKKIFATTIIFSLAIALFFSYVQSVLAVSQINQTRYYTTRIINVNKLGKVNWLQAKENYYFSAISATYKSARSLCSGAVGTGTYRSDVSIRHANGTETVIGSDVAQITRSGVLPVSQEGFQSAILNVPQTSLVTTDAIKVVEKVYSSGPGSPVIPYTGYDLTVFSTEQLGAIQLSAATWTFNRYTMLREYCGPSYGVYTAAVYYSTPKYATRIDGFSYVK
jgi:hypothetical protein